MSSPRQPLLLQVKTSAYRPLGDHVFVQRHVYTRQIGQQIDEIRVGKQCRRGRGAEAREEPRHVPTHRRNAAQNRQQRQYHERNAHNEPHDPLARHSRDSSAECCGAAAMPLPRKRMAPSSHGLHMEMVTGA
jgi:hypothetical protein